MTNKDVIIGKAYAQVGTKEQPPGSNNVIYNTLFYGHKVAGSTFPWCAAFIWFLFKDDYKNFPKTASCANLANYFKKEGRFITADPEPGDIVFYKFGSRGNWTNHTGIVVEVNGSNIKTIEGNTSVNSDDNGGAVMLRKRNFKNVVGFGRPLYNEISDEKEKEPAAVEKPTLKKGDKNEYVRSWRNYLITLGYQISAGDYFNTEMLEAVKDYQRKRKLTPDGIIGPLTWFTVGKA